MSRCASASGFLSLVFPRLKLSQALRLTHVSHDSASSFLAMTTIISKMLAKSPYDSNSFSPSDYTGGLPETHYVAENQNMLMLRLDNHYYLRQDPDGWSEYTP